MRRFSSSPSVKPAGAQGCSLTCLFIYIVPWARAHQKLQWKYVPHTLYSLLLDSPALDCSPGAPTEEDLGKVLSCRPWDARTGRDATSKAHTCLLLSRSQHLVQIIIQMDSSWPPNLNRVSQPCCREHLGGILIRLVVILS